jgi:hypothetical protein
LIDVYPPSHLPYLVRILLDRPDLAQHTISLDVWMRDRRLMKDIEHPDRSDAHPYYDIFLRAGSLLTIAKPSIDELTNWSAALYQYQEVALHAFLLTLLPHLQDLKLYAPLTNGPVFSWREYTGLGRDYGARADYSYLDVALRNKSIKSLYIGLPFSIKQYPSTTLTSLEIGIFFFIDRTDVVNKPMVLPNVQSLTVVINIPILSGRKLHRFARSMKPRKCLVFFLRYVIPNMVNFAIASPRGTLPFAQRTCRLDRFGTPRPASIHLSHDPQDIEAHPMDDPGRDLEGWDWLVEILRPLKSRLKRLELPLEYYSSIGWYVQPMNSLCRFRRLETLVVPRVVIMPNRNGKGYDSDIHEMRAVDFLPKSVKKLVVSQVDMETCAWIQEAFAEKERLPEWEEVVLHFKRDYVAVLSFGFEDAARDAGVKVFASCRGQEMVL